MFTLDEYRAMVKKTTCRWCNAPLPETVLSYPHPNGWPVAGMEGTHWLYLECPNCSYDWALWKLGVNRFPEQLLEREAKP
jgi:hypothetical protein